MTNEEFLVEFMDKAISLRRLGVDEFAFLREDAIKIVESMMIKSVAVLGGDFYSMKSGKPRHTGETWYCDRFVGESLGDYVSRSGEKAIERMSMNPGRQNLVYCLVLDSGETAGL